MGGLERRGYARASTDDQSTEVQREQLEAAGCSTVLSENVSGTYEGRKPKLTEAQVADLKQRHAAEVSLSTLAREFSARLARRL
jgi:hypothetical protein